MNGFERFVWVGMLATILVVSGGFGAEAFAGPAQPKLGQSQAGYYRMQVGDVDVIALSDGTIPVDAKLLDAKPERIDELLSASRIASPVDASVNAFLIIKDNRLILVDAGAGKLMGPTLGKLPASLRAVGYTPEQITDILLTHIHGDHSGGLMVDDRPVFPNAIVHVNRLEAEYWLDPANKANAPAHRRKMFDGARASVGPYADAGKLQLFDGRSAVVPGITSVPTPGHTPGHSFYVLESKGETLVFWGDIIHVAEVQFPDPGVTIQYDADPKAAAAQRRRAFEEAASEGSLVAAAHVAFPGVGRVAKDGAGYRWIVLPFVNDAHPTGK
jgi:glyoxylase-like metal-dependent hydrolase (beta-lactamase superfamily II)